MSQAEQIAYRAVIFDIGGVVVGSPLEATARYERDQGISEGFLGRVVLESEPDGAWPRLERGELSLEEFFPAFDQECRAAGQPISARDLLSRIAAASDPRPMMLEAIRRIRAGGLGTAALTNNWIGGWDGKELLYSHFDAFIESSIVGLRKPDPRIYRLACKQLSIEPRQAVFLDDIGRNLKPARELGMMTIKVVDPVRALGELGTVLGLPLVGAVS